MAGLDLARASVGPSLRPWQWAAGWALVVALAWVRRSSLRKAAPVLALAAALVPVYVDHGRVLQSDGIHYYTWFRSPVFDRDLQLANDYELLGSGYRSPNVLPVGAPLLWSVFLLPLHAGRVVAGVFGAGSPSGTEPLYQAAP